MNFTVRIKKTLKPLIDLKCIKNCAWNSVMRGHTSLAQYNLVCLSNVNVSLPVNLPRACGPEKRKQVPPSQKRSNKYRKIKYLFLVNLWVWPSGPKRFEFAKTFFPSTYCYEYIIIEWLVLFWSYRNSFLYNLGFYRKCCLKIYFYEPNENS